MTKLWRYDTDRFWDMDSGGLFQLGHTHAATEFSRCVFSDSPPQVSTLNQAEINWKQIWINPKPTRREHFEPTLSKYLEATPRIKDAIKIWNEP